MVFHWDWGIPGLQIPVPPTRDDVGPALRPLAWRKIAFNPLGLYDLRRRLGVYPNELGVFQAHSDRFYTADIGWVSSGTSTDNSHSPKTDQFFPEFDALRNSLPIGPPGNQARRRLNEKLKTALFDMATLWDHAFGGTTLVLHIEGTSAPGAPPEPQYLRASGYIPPSFIDSHPESHVVIASTVQLFFEAIGVPTVQQWTANARAQGWSLTETGRPYPNLFSPHLVPAPAAGTSHFKFLGWPVGELQRMLSIPPGPPSVPAHTSARPPVIVIPDDDEDIMDALERAT
ncbi:hypothetical protein C8R45DRAFT_931017 [Mycena sanguinolenta]|nr:hypothetical protein C8R45DRAFT_931017 [Mycena sanguinolenta]